MTDFSIYDNRKEEVIRSFRTDEDPLDLIFLIDVSGSMRTAKDTLAESSRLAFDQLRHGDRVALMTFDTSAHLVSDFSGHFDLIAADIQQVLRSVHHGGTRIHQAVYDASNYFLTQERTKRRRAILILTDDLSIRTRSELTVIRNLWEADALLSGIVIPNPPNKMRLVVVGVLAPYMLPRIRGFEGIAEQTGGEALYSKDLDLSLPEMVHRIRNRYNLYYQAPLGTPGSYRTIRVELSARTLSLYPGARVYARRGYRLRAQPN